MIENSRRCSFGYDQRVEVFGKGGSISGANRSPQDVLVNTEDGLNAGESLVVKTRSLDSDRSCLGTLGVLSN